ncbi:amidohydrolase family protein [Sediminibacterium soli]|uniref:amidohydrolase family protein n=1 Tax=Sediminibacterium soli TaxID=2698829 RepID=UPI00137B3133|nr:amidohydrolase family protein [Sediminibacterium soli]NCI46913.1 amidohydrolase family protein [Sediminibacterium soli]
MRIDAHQHFWQYHAGMEWISDEMSVIRRDFTPADLLPLLQQSGIDGCVAVQANQSEAETDYLLDFANRYDFIRGVVGWVNLRAANIEEKLAGYRQHPHIKGFRHILQGEAPEFMLERSFVHGIGCLHKYAFTYDILVYPRHLTAVKELVAAFPQQAFVIDHLAKPEIRSGKTDEWAKQLRAIAAYPNVHCKVSGMVTEADWHNWRQADLVPYLDVVTEAFGTDRLIYGSDWPVCLVAASYGQSVDIIRNYYSAAEQEKILGANAVQFYHL